jgi:hypothetical protein
MSTIILGPSRVGTSSVQVYIYRRRTEGECNHTVQTSMLLQCLLNVSNTSTRPEIALDIMSRGRRDRRNAPYQHVSQTLFGRSCSTLD